MWPISLASGYLTATDALAILSRVTGHSFGYYHIPLDVIRQRVGEDAVRMHEWFGRVGYKRIPPRSAVSCPTVAFQDFESWAKTRDWNALLQSA